LQQRALWRRHRRTIAIPASESPPNLPLWQGPHGRTMFER
jgi:hypothetical protein